MNSGVGRTAYRSAFRGVRASDKPVSPLKVKSPVGPDGITAGDQADMLRGIKRKRPVTG